MPELLRALEVSIPSASSLFGWVDEKHQLQNIYSTNSYVFSHLPLYVSEFHNSKKETVAVGVSFSDAMRFKRSWRNTERLGRQFYSSELYDVFCRPIFLHHGIQAIIFDHGRSLGFVVLTRTVSERPYSEEDERKLHSLIPYIAHGVRGKRDLRGEMTSSGESGTLIVGSQNKIEAHCSEGKRLLLLAMHPTYGSAQSANLNSALIQSLCRNLRGILEGKPSPPPVLRRQNGWGEFVFRAYPLDGEPEVRGSVVVVIERHVPLTIKLISNMRSSTLTARQREVGILLSYGYTQSMIAKRMGISKHTAIDYVRKIYEKLDVVGQTQLMQKLTSDPNYGYREV